jgi:hypothetical protein
MVENAIINIDKRFDYLHKRFDLIECKIDSTHSAVNLLSDKINSRMWTNFYWVMGAIGGLFLMMAHGFKWI